MAEAAAYHGPSAPAFDFMARMCRGINIGNVMLAPSEGSWQAPIERFFMTDISQAGISTVRVTVVRWEAPLLPSHCDVGAAVGLTH